MEERKPEVSQVESVPVAEHKHTIEALAINEDEPQTPYQLGWRTILAVLTLSMANVCAALSNTVSHSPHAIWFIAKSLRPTRQLNSKSRPSQNHR